MRQAGQPRPEQRQVPVGTLQLYVPGVEQQVTWVTVRVGGGEGEGCCSGGWMGGRQASAGSLPWVMAIWVYCAHMWLWLWLAVWRAEVGQVLGWWLRRGSRLQGRQGTGTAEGWGAVRGDGHRLCLRLADAQRGCQAGYVVRMDVQAGTQP